MGGSGSGSWTRWDTKSTTEGQHRIDIHWLEKNGYLFPGMAGTLSWSRGNEQTGWVRFSTEHDQMILFYRVRRIGEEWQDIEEHVYFDYTPCNYGGSRKWFLCPQCNRRVAVLFCGGKYFLCRHCYDLVYSSQQETQSFRGLRKAHKIRKRLGGYDSGLGPFPGKPKHMHWKTYWRLRAMAVQAEASAWAGIADTLGVPFP